MEGVSLSEHHAWSVVGAALDCCARSPATVPVGESSFSNSLCGPKGAPDQFEHLFDSQGKRSCAWSPATVPVWESSLSNSLHDPKGTPTNQIERGNEAVYKVQCSLRQRLPGVVHATVQTPVMFCSLSVLRWLLQYIAMLYTDASIQYEVL